MGLWTGFEWLGMCYTLLQEYHSLLKQITQADMENLMFPPSSASAERSSSCWTKTKDKIYCPIQNLSFPQDQGHSLCVEF